MQQLFLEENILSKGDKIAVRLRNEFKPNSKPYRQWLNKTAEYNTTSLTHVFNEYFNDHSVGDIGGDSIDYVPRRGYPGTLAPGENFKEDNAFEDLPKKILHPWPAMQEIPFACRWPPAHPMIPPPLLWFAMNDMFTEVRVLLSVNLSLLFSSRLQ